MFDKSKQVADRAERIASRIATGLSCNCGLEIGETGKKIVMAETRWFLTDARKQALEEVRGELKKAMWLEPKTECWVAYDTDVDLTIDSLIEKGRG